MATKTPNDQNPQADRNLQTDRNPQNERLQTDLEQVGATPTLRRQIRAMEPRIAAVLPPGISADKIIHTTYTVLTENPKLAGCDPQSVLGGVMRAAQLGLEIGQHLGEAWLIPRGSKAGFQLGYKGLVTLLWRSARLASLQVKEVKENDDFEYRLGTDPYIHHQLAPRARGGTIWFYLVAKYTTGGEFPYIMSIEEVEVIRDQYSEAWKRDRDTPWKTDPDAMGKKTVLGQAAHWMPKSPAMQAGLYADGRIVEDIESSMIPVQPVGGGGRAIGDAATHTEQEALSSVSEVH
tara:strand:- start:2561 stop:3436 length:876 start_codon:yes stop_codon:yes gene_type:complete